VRQAGCVGEFEGRVCQAVWVKPRVCTTGRPRERARGGVLYAGCVGRAEDAHEGGVLYTFHW
jgi:hypothetical protein